jgi:serine protease Do
MTTGLRNRRGGAVSTALFIVLALLVGGLLGSLATAMSGRSVLGPAHSVPLLVTSANSLGGNTVSFDSGFAPVAKALLPAVVNVSSSSVVRATPLGQGSPLQDPLFREFFGNGLSRQFNVPQERREHSLGSGVIVSPEGYILTNYHVVEKASDVKVSRGSSQEVNARVIGTDPKTDLAVLKIDEKNLPVVTFGDSAKVQVGEFALAVGNPFGVGQTVTMGIVSATGRGGLGIETYEDFIQTDASINPGNSGGALANVRGELIGVNTAILSRTGGNAGIGFAVPVNMARQVMEQIIKNGKVVRGWLGVMIQPVTPQIAKAFELSGAPRGALVGDVTEGSPAAKAGIQKGDIITDLNGQAVNDSRDLSLKVSMTAPGSVEHLKIFRNGSEHDLTVTLAEMPAGPQQNAAPSGGDTGGSPVLQGLAVDQLTPDFTRQLGLPNGTQGVVITGVQQGSVAAESGLERGDVIQEVNRKPVTTVDQFQRAVRQAQNGPLLLLVNRGGQTLYLTLQSQ